MSLADALKAAGVSAFHGKPGDVYLAEDTEIVIPETKDDERKWHQNGRPCVILSNDVLCSDPAYRIVSIAPISHRVDLKARADFDLSPTRQNGLHEPSLIMLGHIQPVRKQTLFKKIGELSNSEWEAMLAHIVDNFDRA